MEDDDDISTHKLKSAVHAFLEKNGKDAETEAVLGEEAPDTVLVSRDNTTGEIVAQVHCTLHTAHCTALHCTVALALLHCARNNPWSVLQKIRTIQSPDGSVRTIKTVESLKNGENNLDF
jgi:hypothetical protein